MTRTAILLGGAGSCGRAIADALRGAGYATLVLPEGTTPPTEHATDVAVFALSAPAGAAAADTDVAAMIDALDTALISAGLAARDLFARTSDRRDRRIVVLCDWAVTGPPSTTIEAAVMGGMLGLARSWALEFAPLGITVNAVVVGPDLVDSEGAREVPKGLVRSPTPSAVAHAVLYFLSPDAGCVTGQVLTVCGGRTAARLPI